MKIALECTHEQYHALHEAVDAVRAGSRTVKVDKEALARLLRDHGALIRRQQGEILKENL